VFEFKKKVSKLSAILARNKQEKEICKNNHFFWTPFSAHHLVLLTLKYD